MNPVVKDIIIPDNAFATESTRTKLIAYVTTTFENKAVKDAILSSHNTRWEPSHIDYIFDNLFTT
jgi:hypothetical protein